MAESTSAGGRCIAAAAFTGPGLNQGKRSVTIDTRTEVGQRQVAGLIAAPGEGGGIVLTNLPVRGWNSYGELSKLRRDLIMVVITGDRDGGTAVDYTVNAALGFPWLTGPEGHDGPVNHVLPAWDGMTGFLAAFAILAAERHRRLHGEGQLVELSLSDVGLAMAGHLGLIGEAILEPEPRGRFGNDVYGTFGRDFGTRDGRRVMVLALTARQWVSLGEATGLRGDFAELESRVGADFEMRAIGGPIASSCVSCWNRGSHSASWPKFAKPLTGTACCGARTKPSSRWSRKIRVRQPPTRCSRKSITRAWDDS